MKVTALSAASLLVLSSLAADPVSARAVSWTYNCSGGDYSVNVYNLDDYHVAVIDGAGNGSVLLSSETGSGELYKSDTFEISSKGKDAIITFIDGGKRFQHKDCKLSR
ncbi:hypothetical protein [Dyella tabacisoli]|uniref:hypothetical protein n=1 Tax=Dyella tabacisoli TaxID=2282381 RepID=UPI0013B39EDC|nr:hypothetical protein [Dyella tabacisoli]